jgi:hypothetical protein
MMTKHSLNFSGFLEQRLERRADPSSYPPDVRLDQELDSGVVPLKTWLSVINKLTCFSAEKQACLIFVGKLEVNT